MIEFLKHLFGTAEDGSPVSLTYEQLAAKIGADEKLKIVNLADGGFVSKDKYAAAETKISGLSQQLKDANETIQSYKDMDIEGIKKAAGEWETKYNTETQALQDKIDAMAYNHAVDMFMQGYSFTSKAAAAGIRAEFDSKKFELKDGQFVGAKEWMDGLVKHEDYKAAFVVADPNPDPKPPQFGDPNPSGNPAPTRLSLTELMVKKNADPNYKVKYD